MDHTETYARLRDAVNKELEKCFSAGGALADAMRYSLLAGGKRIRPVLLLAFCEMAGGSAAEALPAACGLEMERRLPFWRGTPCRRPPSPVF